MLSQDQFDRLIGLIYEAALESERWADFLGEYAAATGSDSMALVVQDLRHQRANVNATFRVDPASERSYEKYYASVNPWVVGRDTEYVSGAVTNSIRMISNTDLERTEYHADFLRPNNWMYSYGIVIRRDADLVSFLTGLRSQRSGPFGEAEEHLVERLMPHLQNALRVHRRLAGFNATLQAANEALDRLPHAVVITDGSRKILLANQTAERMLAANDGVYASARAIHARYPLDDRKLEASISRAALRELDAVRLGGTALTISRPSGRAALELLVWPLPVRSELGGHGPAAVLFITDPETDRTPGNQALHQLYGLTPAEAKLASALAAGKSLEEYASEAQVNISTVRTHLKHLFSKMSVGRQSELVRRILSGVSILET